MTTSADVVLTNGTDNEMRFIIEPWGDSIPFPPRKKFRVLMEATSDGNMEVTYGDSYVVIWGWPSAVIVVFADDEVVWETNIPVPPLPPGLTTSSFLGLIFGQEK
jgi:hypothetical protein